MQGFASFNTTQAEMIIVLILFWKPYKSKESNSLSYYGLSKLRESTLFEKVTSLRKDSKSLKKKSRNYNYKFYEDSQGQID